MPFNHSIWTPWCMPSQCHSSHTLLPPLFALPTTPLTRGRLICVLCGGNKNGRGLPFSLAIPRVAAGEVCYLTATKRKNDISRGQACTSRPYDHLQFPSLKIPIFIPPTKMSLKGWLCAGAVWRGLTFFTASKAALKRAALMITLGEVHGGLRSSYYDELFFEYFCFVFDDSLKSAMNLFMTVFAILWWWRPYFLSWPIQTRTSSSHRSRSLACCGAEEQHCALRAADGDHVINVSPVHRRQVQFHNAQGQCMHLMFNVLCCFFSSR